MSFGTLRILVPDSVAAPLQAALAVSSAGPFDVVERDGEAAFDATGFDAVLLAQSTGLDDLPAHAAATALVVLAEVEIGRAHV